jgi:hypothetical protein
MTNSYNLLFYWVLISHCYVHIDYRKLNGRYSELQIKVRSAVWKSTSNKGTYVYTLDYPQNEFIVWMYAS